MGIQRHLPRILAQLILVVILSFSSNAAEQERVPRFYADDPVCCAPQPLHIPEIKARKTDTLFDFLYNSFAEQVYTDTPAESVNTLGDVLDSEWFINRHGRKRLSVKELKQGSGDGRPPRPPYVVVGAKLDGITPGFRMRDSEGTVYFVKPDPLKYPELATAADAMGARFFPCYRIQHAGELHHACARRGHYGESRCNTHWRQRQAPADDDSRYRVYPLEGPSRCRSLLSNDCKPCQFRVLRSDPSDTKARGQTTRTIWYRIRTGATFAVCLFSVRG